jgi:hypothetical protein
MKYTVIWLPTAQQLLAQLWNTASDRAAVSAASNAIDAALQRDPLGIGESRGSVTRTLAQAPLRVYYDVSPDDCQVTVWAVARLP